MTYNRPKGTEDWFGARMARLAALEGVIRDTCAEFLAEEIRTPVMEQAELFRRGMGEGTDVVRKEMFTLTDAGGRELTLKPEGTAGAVRAFLENGMHKAGKLPAKLFYIAPMFRAERPQKGRLRQFHQFGAEMLGTSEAKADAELVLLASALLARLGVGGVCVRVNTIGCPDCRARYRARLADYLSERAGALCADCRERMASNPLRVLDCKNEKCKEAIQDAPVPLDDLDDDCAAHFAEFKAHLDDYGVAYEIDPRMVRGLDYYTRTVFEIVSDQLGAQSAVVGGGRYDGLIETLGGPSMGAVGFAMGLERLMILMDEQGTALPNARRNKLLIGAAGEGARAFTRRLVGEYARLGLRGVCRLDGSVKNIMKEADKIGVDYVVIIGDTEIETGRVRVKKMATGEALDCTIEELRKGELKWETL